MSKEPRPPGVFRLPDDPVARAWVTAKFYSFVSVPKGDATLRCWEFRMPGGRKDFFSSHTAGQTFHGKPEVIAWTIAFGPLDLGDRVRATCATPGCCRPDHLAVLRPAVLAAEVRDLYRSGVPRAEIARRLGMPWSSVNRLTRRAA